MLTDKDMAMDALESKKAFIGELTKAALECSNPSLKTTLIQMRNRCEQSQQELAQMVQSKGWYMASAPADQSDIRRIQSFFSQPMQQQMPSQHMGNQWQQQPYNNQDKFQ